jgi:para-nitrobenzyl esterase
MKNIVVIFSLFFSSVLCLNADEIPRIQIENTEYVGSFDVDRNQFIFRGIPYAKPPINELRWMPPIPYKTEKTSIAAQSFKPACMQDNGNTNWYRNVAISLGNPISMVHKTPPISEDCLYLNIWSQSLDTEQKQPVMVWIHGGGNVNGYSHEPNYLGYNLAQKGVVVVSINFRLNALGYLPHPENPNSSGNYGLMDQLTALKWIKDNIIQFGGDPNNITLFGESSGAEDIAYLIASPAAQGLFQRAISQSGGFIDWVKKDEGLALGIEIQEKSGSESLAAMRNISAESIVKIRSSSDLYYKVSVDGDLIPDDPFKLYLDQNINNVDLLIGSTRNEYMMYGNPNITDQETTDWVEKTYPEDSKAILELMTNKEPVIAMDQLQTNRDYLCPSVFIARQLSKNGNNVYQYIFDKERQNSESIKAYHGAEIPYVFNTHDDWLPTDPMDLELTEIMMEYWVEFAKKGTPNSINNPTWKEFGDDENYQILDIPIQQSNKSEFEFCTLFIEQMRKRAFSD